MKEKTLSIITVAKELKVKTEIIRENISSGRIPLSGDGRIPLSILQEIKKQKEQFTNVKDFLLDYTCDSFNPKYVRDRNEFEYYLETHDYFGIRRHEPYEFLFCSCNENTYYFENSELQRLSFECIPFFENYGIPNGTKIERIINSTEGHTTTKKYLEMFYFNKETCAFTSSDVAFVRIIMGIPDIMSMSSSDIVSMADELSEETQRTKAKIVSFFEYVSGYLDLPFERMTIKQQKYRTIPAYSEEETIGLSLLMFNPKNEQKLTIKALEKSSYAEMWLFHCCHFICGWRPSDICEKWVYPTLSEHSNIFEISISNLRESIINDEIPKEKLSLIAKYCENQIMLKNNHASKTGFGRLFISMHKSLLVFFGKLVLIAEYHHLSSGQGYMKKERAPYYNNRINCRAFYGDSIIDCIGDNNLESRRLNKTFLQGLEKAALDNGNTFLSAHQIASLARNHKSLNTTIQYLRDGFFTNETAETTLYFLQERGVLSFMGYNLFSLITQDSFKLLSNQEKTSLLSKLNHITPYQIEVAASVFNATTTIKDEFKNGNTTIPTEILKSMIAFTNGKGYAKDEGVYCYKLAFGQECENPTYSSCLANICPYHVFTTEGLPSLIKVVKEYHVRAKTSERDKTILNEIILPAFGSIISEIIRTNKIPKNILLSYIKEANYE